MRAFRLILIRSVWSCQSNRILKFFQKKAAQPRVNHDPASAALQPAESLAKSLGFAAVMCQFAGQVTQSLGGFYT